MAEGNRIFSVRPMPVGAEIVGLDLAALDDVALRDRLYQLWLDFGLLLFRLPGISNAQHIALSRVFGDLERHPVPEIWAQDEPLLIELGGSKRGPAYYFDDEENPCIGKLPWHRDTAYTTHICKGAMLRMVEVPEVAGLTLFADTALAYDRLPEALKARLETLEFKATLRIGPIEQTGPGALWQRVREATEAENPGGKRSENVTAAAKARYPSVIQPAIITHPESGRKCLFPSPTYVDYFLGLSQQESDALLAEVTAFATDPAVTYAHSWRADDLMLWDNRRMMHAASGYPVACTRKGLRTTLADPMLTGRAFDPVVPAEWPAMAD